METQTQKISSLTITEEILVGILVLRERWHDEFYCNVILFCSICNDSTD